MFVFLESKMDKKDQLFVINEVSFLSLIFQNLIEIL